MLENKLIYPPKVKWNKTNLLSATRIPACTIKVSLTKHFFENNFPQVKEIESFPLSHIHAHRYLTKEPYV